MINESDFKISEDPDYDMAEANKNEASKVSEDPDQDNAEANKNEVNKVKEKGQENEAKKRKHGIKNKVNRQLFQTKKVIVIFCLVTVSFALFVMIFYHTKSNPEDIGKELKQKTNNVSSIANDTCQDEIITLIGDGFCDDEANDEKCFYDLGDCCQFENPETFFTCSSCQCKVNVSNWLNNQVGGHLSIWIFPLGNYF